MDPLLAGLEVLAVGLPALLSIIAFLAARRYSETRFAFVGAGLLALGVVGLLGLVQALTGDIPSASLGYPTVGLLLVAEGLLYLSLVTKRTTPGRPADG